MVTVLLAILAFVLIAAGFIGVFLPILPGVPLAWLGFIIFAAGTGFDIISVPLAIGMTAGMGLVMLLDFLAPMLGAKKYKASRWGIAGTTVGLIVGLIFFNIWGVIFGPFVGAFAGELIARKPAGAAFRSAFGAFIGFIAGTLLRVTFIGILVWVLLTHLFS